MGRPLDRTAIYHGRSDHANVRIRQLHRPMSRNSTSLQQTHRRAADHTRATSVAAGAPLPVHNVGSASTWTSSWSRPPRAWHLLNLKTMKPVKSYAQLSRIMQNLGWFFYVTPQRDLWCTWWACHESHVQHACLPYPHIGVATRTELKQFVKRLEYAGLVGVFDVEAGELPGSRLRDDIKAGNIQVSLAVKGTNRQIETYKDLAEALVVRGWKRVSDNHFYRFEGSLITPNCHVISVIHMPVLRSFRQVCLDDLESIVLLTGSLFYLHFNNVVAMDSSLSTQNHMSTSTSNSSSLSLLTHDENGEELNQERNKNGEEVPPAEGGEHVDEGKEASK
ncbi:hypothetical protein CY35_06G116100 [Sphagnum magellanicum]|nr:hypothetical protein CY35_06G116100 [Sphagnum magellanicum]